MKIIFNLLWNISVAERSSRFVLRAKQAFARRSAGSPGVCIKNKYRSRRKNVETVGGRWPGYQSRSVTRDACSGTRYRATSCVACIASFLVASCSIIWCSARWLIQSVALLTITTHRDLRRLLIIHDNFVIHS